MERVSAIMGSRAVASIIPVTLAILGALIANVPVSFLGGIVPPPLLGLMPVYFWCLVRPDLMPPFWAFAIGLLEDILSGGPPGVWAVSFVVTYAAIDRQRDAFAGLSGLGAIVGFATAAAISCATAYVVVAMYYWRMPPLAPVMGELAMTVFFYLPAVVFLGLIHRRLVGPLRSDF
jgi:rod shape-determining protein MreD